jgi:glycyl-tRNA synthetase
MRELARRTSEAYVEQRKTMEYPWMAEPNGKAAAVAAAKPVSLQKGPADFLLEIGTEELPGADFTAAVEQLKSRVPAMLDELRLAHGAIEVIGTPRRLIVKVKDLADQQQARTTVVKGPPKNRAYDETGQTTRALEGFAQGKGVAVADLEAREIDGGVYMVALVKEATRCAYDVLHEALPGLVTGIKFDKSMRWNHTNVPFSRPVRWLVALLGGTVIPFEFAGLTAQAQTHGLRFIEPQVLPINDAADHEKVLAAQGIILDPEKRKEAIRGQVLAISKNAGGSDKLDEGLLDEVTFLVEAPFAFLGTFEDSHLQLPPEVLISVMKKHQRYFPVQAADGKLLPHFIAVRNGSEKAIDLVTDGNEQVVRARFADANFFIREDLKHPLETMLTRLGTLTFQQKLGSMLDKSKRITALVEKLAPVFDLTGEDLKTAKRAATLCKADLVTHMVVEMTSLQGVMGRYYARFFGESEGVAQALYDQYLPRFAGDALPSNKIGLAIGVSDRLDSLCGLFAAGLAPTGTKDPFAQRRSALGLVQSLGAFDLDIDLREALKAAAAQYPFDIDQKSLDATLEFVVGRLKNSLTDQGFRYDVVDAVLAEQGFNPAGVYRAVKELTGWTSRADWATILPAFARCVRITRDQKQVFTVIPEVFAEQSEKELFNAVVAIEKNLPQRGSVDALFNAFVPAIPQVNRFFDEVLVMAEDARLRSNRLGLLQRISALAKGVVDLSCLEGF